VVLNADVPFSGDIIEIKKEKDSCSTDSLRQTSNHVSVIGGNVPKKLRGSLACTGLCADPWRSLRFARAPQRGAKTLIRLSNQVSKHPVLCTSSA
jgi:hypothetical protein